MRSSKLKLNLDDLAVDSFRTGAASGGAGTVKGHYLEEDRLRDTVYRPTDPSSIHDTVLRYTEWLSCGGTCGTCGGTDCWA